MLRFQLFLERLKVSFLQGRESVATLFLKQPQLSMAVVVFVFGLLAILTNFPTIAGALFGAGAAFIGSWATERNRTTGEKAAEQRRMEAARLYFAPELGRIVAQQIYVLDRIVANFICASVGKHPLPGDQVTSFKPWQPVLYPAAVQFRDLSEADATSLIAYYDSLHEITEIINGLARSETPKELVRQ